jgi:membrane protease YdiL (CAAX protease family)
MKEGNMHRRQLIVFFSLLVVYAVIVFLSSTILADQLGAPPGTPMPQAPQLTTAMGLAIAGVILVAYGIAGLLGYWFARKLGLPGIFSEDGNWRRWFFLPLLFGLICGVLIVAADILFAPINGFGSIPHPPFPVSIVASLGAGIGEELLFRGFVFGLWGLILNWLLKRFNGRTAALWIANVIAALAFGASHFGTIFFLTGAKSLSELNPVLIVELFLMNGITGLIAGQRYMKDGLVAASGVHFWADMVWHVVWGLFG